MTKRNNKKRGSLLQRIMTWIGAFIVGLVTLVVAVLGGLLESSGTLPGDSNPPAGTPVAVAPSGDVEAVNISQGFGATRDFWQVYFTAPTGSRDPATYRGGIDIPLVSAINNVQQTLDIAAFEWNNPALTQAVIDAHNRGVRVRMVVDDEHTLEDEDSTIQAVIDAGVPVRDDSRSGLMHNKFMIMDGSTVWTGSMNFTMNGTYRNNNNLIALRARRAVEAYQTEFNEMFEGREFGSSRSTINAVNFTQNGTPVEVVFSPEDGVVSRLIEQINSAQRSVHFMTFSFTLDDVGEALLAQAQRGVDVQGIFEVRGSRTQFSELPRLLCAGLDVREDGNPFTFHHKVFIIDGQTVLTGSFNISNNATESNDENMVIIQDASLAAQYLAEFERVWSQSANPPRSEITCP